MTQSSLHYVAFLREVLTSHAVYTVHDTTGIPCPPGDGGIRAMPFWSSASRAEAIIAKVPAYHGMSVRRLDLTEFISKWLPGLQRDGFNAGCNWSGERALGYDIDPASLLNALQAAEPKIERK
jgi:hypothetical protein